MTNLKLINSKFTKINAEKNSDFNGKLKLNTNISIISLKEIKENINIIKISYIFEINYNELGKISINGDLFLSGDSKIIKNILKMQKDKEYNTPEYIIITNLIIQKASIKAFELEEELNLPIHIKLPSLSIKN
jgi:hypothetical protein